MDFKAAIFDLDGTLIDSLILWEVIWEGLGSEFLGEKSFRPTAEDEKVIRTMVLGEAMELIHKNYNMGKCGKELLDFTNRLIIGYYSNSIELKPGVREYLDYLYSKGIKMCIASASSLELINAAVKHCNINKYFSYIFSCDTLGVGKNVPDIYLLAQENLKESACNICVFEDSYVAVKTAKKIGMKTVGIYDKCNFAQDEIENTADEYIAAGQTLTKLIK